MQTHMNLKIASVDGKLILVDLSIPRIATNRDGTVKQFTTRPSARGSRSLLQSGKRPFYANGE